MANPWTAGQTLGRLELLGIALVLLGIAISARLTPVLNISRFISWLVT